jgi:hypothetical protein
MPIMAMMPIVAVMPIMTMIVRLLDGAGLFDLERMNRGGDWRRFCDRY